MSKHQQYYIKTSQVRQFLEFSVFMLMLIDCIKKNETIFFQYFCSIGMNKMRNYHPMHGN